MVKLGLFVDLVYSYNITFAGPERWDFHHKQKRPPPPLLRVDLRWTPPPFQNPGSVPAIPKSDGLGTPINPGFRKVCEAPGCDHAHKKVAIFFSFPADKENGASHLRLFLYPHPVISARLAGTPREMRLRNASQASRRCTDQCRTQQQSGSYQGGEMRMKC